MCDLTRMEAVASGRACVVARWAAALRAAGIGHHVARATTADDGLRPDGHAELWVATADAEAARAAILSAGGSDSKLLW